jgi:hypothetical protein
MVVALVVAVVGFYSHRYHDTRVAARAPDLDYANQARPEAAESTPAAVEASDSTPEPSGSEQSPFHCDGRIYCSEMRSCAEAKYFLAHCPNVKMDGDHDGIPCERQWCPTG